MPSMRQKIGGHHGKWKGHDGNCRRCRCVIRGLHLHIITLMMWPLHITGVEFRWSWGTAILALEKFELMRAAQQFQWLVRGTKANLKILKGHHSKLCSYSHLTSYIFLKLKDEREGAGLACPSFGNCIELFSLVKTLLTIDKTTHWQGRAPRQEVKRVQHYTAVTRSQI